MSELPRTPRIASNRAETANKPPINIGFILRLSDVQNSLRGLFSTIQVVTTLDPTANKV
jgi:hypothetical protein